MDVEISLKESIEKNAERYFQAAKNARKKMKGVEKAIAEARRNLEAAQETLPEQAVHKKKPRKRLWYEKFRWFISSDGFLVIGGRDATTNEIVVKKHANKGDLVFHTDIPGSPFVVVQAEGKQAQDRTKEEAAQFCASYSKAWKRGMTTAEVYHVSPDQVSKEAKAGEYLMKGAFMIYGKRQYHQPALSLAVGIHDDKVMAGPLAAVKKHCSSFVVVRQGDKKLSDVAKKIQHKIGGELDDIVRVLPQGVTA